MPGLYPTSGWNHRFKHELIITYLALHPSPMTQLDLKKLRETATNADMVLVFFSDGTAQVWYYRTNTFLPRVQVLFSPSHFHTFGIAVACAIAEQSQTLHR